MLIRNQLRTHEKRTMKCAIILRTGLDLKKSYFRVVIKGNIDPSKRIVRDERISSSKRAPSTRETRTLCYNLIQKALRREASLQSEDRHLNSECGRWKERKE